MKQKIINFHQDDEAHWVADLACGHKQHVRHDPPLVQRDWVLSAETRKEYLGQSLDCKRCDELGLVIARYIQAYCKQTAKDAYYDAANSGLCNEGQLDFILDKMNALDLEKLSQDAIKEATSDLGTLTD